MLAKNTSFQPFALLPSKKQQQGVTLFITLIALVVMTLAAIGLMRAVSTNVTITGNLAFRQNAAQAGNTGIETAIAWLQANSSGTTLQNDSLSNGYVAHRQDPGVGETWPAFWNGTLQPGGMTATTSNATSSGNTVSYIIQRLCATAGDPNSAATQCSTNISGSPSLGNDYGAGHVGLLGSTQVYYRITVKTTGPRNTASYVQAIVLL